LARLGMREYTFRFRSSDWRIEAEFTLQFDADQDARGVARELQNHSRFPIIEVKQGEALIFHLDRRHRKDEAA
jgi:hypothetical protein